MAQIHGLDMSVLQSGLEEERLVFGQQLLASLKNDGFCKIICHPLGCENISEVFQQSREFFSLPYEEKQKLSNDPNSAIQRGWSDVGAEKTWALHGERLGLLGSERSSDSKENFDHGSPLETQFPNKWPSETLLPGFRNKLEKFYDDCAATSNALLDVLATALHMPPASFSSRCKLNQSSTMRFNHFPPVNVSAFETGDTCRIWPHFDFGIITLVFRDPSVGGLEFEDRSKPGTFVPMPCGSQTEMLVNVGETFQRWTNDFLPAALHRVNKPHGEDSLINGMVPERYSIAYFCKADREASVGPYSNFLIDNKKKYDDITALQYQEIRNKATY